MQEFVNVVISRRRFTLEWPIASVKSQEVLHRPSYVGESEENIPLDEDNDNPLDKDNGNRNLSLMEIQFILVTQFSDIRQGTRKCNQDADALRVKSDFSFEKMPRFDLLRI